MMMCDKKTDISVVDKIVYMYVQLYTIVAIQ